MQPKYTIKFDVFDVRCHIFMLTHREDFDQDCPICFITALSRVQQTRGPITGRCVSGYHLCRCNDNGKVAHSRQCTYNNTNARSRNHFCRRKPISITYSECVFVALVIQHAKRKRHIILTSVNCLSLQNFSTLSHKQHDFWKKLLNIKCFFDFLQNFCPKHFSF